MSSSLERAIIEATDLLEEQKIPYCLIGGIAASFYGSDRATFDVDITVQIEPEQLHEFVNQLGTHFESKIEEDLLAFVQKNFYLSVYTKERIVIDFLFTQLPFEFAAIKRAKRKKIFGKEIPIISLEDLLLYKLCSDRAIDIADVMTLLNQWKKKLDRPYLDKKVKEISSQMKEPKIIEFYKNLW